MKEINKNKIEYKVKKNKELNKNEISDFVNTFNLVFNTNYSFEWFEWKYNKNIYGESYFILAYNENKLVGSRVFWRNDLDGKKSYQPVDTFVLKDYRKMGIFYNMTKLALNNIEDGIIYNFPNQNSLPGNLKLGWDFKYNYNLHFSCKSLKENKYILKIDDYYLKWRFLESPIYDYYYFKKNQRYYLLKRRKYNIYYILGEINEKYVKNLRKAFLPILLYYSSEKSKIKILNGKGNLVVRNIKDDIDYIPIIKNDTI